MPKNDALNMPHVIPDAEPCIEKQPAVLMLGKGWFPDQLGGLDRYFRDLLEHLPEATGVVVGQANGRPTRVVAVSSHDASLLRRLVAFGRAARHASQGTEVVDAHFALYALLPLLSRRIRAMPTVVHFQGPWADENTAQGDRSALRCALRRALERTVYGRAQRIVVLSSAFRRLLVERYRISPWCIRVEPPGVDLERFSPGDGALARARLGLEPAAFVVVSVRRLVPRMGLDTLVDAWAHVLPQLPPGSRLLIAGDGPQHRELQDLIASAGVQESAHLLGRVDDDKLVDLYRAADVSIVPTRSFEGFGLVVIEAAACGTPTIVTRVGGLPEAVSALDPSLIVPAGDVPALADRIAKSACAGGLPSRSSTRRFAEGFSWQVVADRNRAVHREALAPDIGARRVRIVYLDHVAQLSGGEIALLRLVPHLDQIDPHFILAEDGPLADELVRSGISVEVMPMRERARAVRKDSVTARSLPLVAAMSTIAYVVRLALRLRRLRPDIVHANSLKAGVYGSLAARLAGVPVVWHVRDRISSDYLPSGAAWAIRMLLRKLVSTVVANSRSTAETLGGVHAAVIPPVVIPEAIIPPSRPEGAKHLSLTVGMIGRLASWKGQELFLRAFAEAFPDGDARCVIVGSAMFGERDHEQYLLDLVDELALGTRVEFRGFCSDVWAELARMDVLVHASIIPEPFGQVILEGMGAGVPVVAANAGGPAEIISDGHDGLLYPIGDRAALAAAMRDLAADPVLRARLAVAGVETVAEYHPRVVAPRMQRVYDDVLERANRAGV